MRENWLLEPAIFASLSKNAPSEFISSHCFVMQRDIREHNCKAYKNVTFSVVCSFKKDLTLKDLSFFAQYSAVQILCMVTYSKVDAWNDKGFFYQKDKCKMQSF